MSELICKVGTVVLAAKSYVPLFIHIHSQWVPTINYYPHSEVKFTLHNQHRVFYVFLNHPPSFLPLFVLVFRVVTTVIKNLVVIVKDCDVTSSRKATWFGNPQVLFSIEFRLGMDLSKKLN